MTNLNIIQTQSCSSITDFISHWSKYYSYYDDSKYKQNINQLQFSNTNLIALYQWKNGMTLSDGKKKSLQAKIINRIALINNHKQLDIVNLENFNADFSDVSAVWRIFLLHTIQPNVFPIYDQHIHRTYNFIHNLEWRSINNTISDKSKLEFYFKIYLPFVQSLGVTDLKAMDEAFFAFGQFLNTRNQSKILENEN